MLCRSGHLDSTATVIDILNLNWIMKSEASRPKLQSKAGRSVASGQFHQVNLHTVQCTVKSAIEAKPVGKLNGYPYFVAADWNVKLSQGMRFAFQERHVQLIQLHHSVCCMYM